MSIFSKMISVDEYTTSLIALIMNINSLSLSTVVLNSRDRQGNLWLP